MSEIRIRKANEEDFEALADVQRQAVDLTLREYYAGNGIDEWLRSIDVDKFRRVAATGEVTLLAEVDGQVVGFTSYKADKTHVGMWYVDPKYQRQGIGKRLLEEAESELKNAGGILANTEASQHAEPLFAKLGWEAIKRYDKPAFGNMFRVTEMVKHL